MCSHKLCLAQKYNVSKFSTKNCYFYSFNDIKICSLHTEAFYVPTYSESSQQTFHSLLRGLRQCTIVHPQSHSGVFLSCHLGRKQERQLMQDSFHQQCRYTVCLLLKKFKASCLHTHNI